ncbi:hypothetical protein D3C87_914870 [compost metagenome]
MTALKNISDLAKEFDSVEAVKAELKRIQSVKCRLKKQKTLSSYEAKMQETLAHEQALKEVRDLLEPKSVTFTTMTKEQIAELNYDETIRAIKSVQSKKCNTQFLTENTDDNVEYQAALKQEQMLLEHKKTVKPVEDTVVKKSQINDLIEQLSVLEQNLDKDFVIARLQELLA